MKTSLLQKLIARCSFLKRERHLIAQTFQAMDQIAREMVFVEFVEVKIAQIVVGNLLGKHVIDGHQDPMGDGLGSALVPATGLGTTKLVSQVGAFGFGCRVGRCKAD